MGMNDLPDMYILCTSTMATGARVQVHVYQAIHQVPMLQLMYYTCTHLQVLESKGMLYVC